MEDLTQTLFLVNHLVNTLSNSLLEYVFISAHPQDYRTESQLEASLTACNVALRDKTSLASLLKRFEEGIDNFTFVISVQVCRHGWIDL